MLKVPRPCSKALEQLMLPLAYYTLADWDYRFHRRAGGLDSSRGSPAQSKKPSEDKQVSPTGIEGRVLTGYLSLNLPRHRFCYPNQYFQSV